jgi:hypothetical protein
MFSIELFKYIDYQEDLMYAEIEAHGEIIKYDDTYYCSELKIIKNLTFE